MTPAQPDFDALVKVQEALLGLTIDPAWRAAIATNLAMTAHAATLFVDLPFDDAHDEAANVFVPLAVVRVEVA
jgi:hypothetical protein